MEYGYWDDPRWAKVHECSKVTIAGREEADKLARIIREDYGLEPIDLTGCEVIIGERSVLTGKDVPEVNLYRPLEAAA